LRRRCGQRTIQRRKMKEGNVRTAVLMGLLLTGPGARLLLAQTTPVSLKAAEISTAKSMPIPKYLVYRHFLAWVNDLDRKAAGASDPYRFAKPFARAGLENSDLDALRTAPSPSPTTRQGPSSPNTGVKRRRPREVARASRPLRRSFTNCRRCAPRF
jgi:hypothetical protein